MHSMDKIKTLHELFNDFSLTLVPHTVAAEEFRVLLYLFVMSYSEEDYLLYPLHREGTKAETMISMQADAEIYDVLCPSHVLSHLDLRVLA